MPARPIISCEMTLHGHTALVTGGAHRIGKAIALALASAGAKVAVHYRSSGQAARETVEEIRSLGVDSWPLQADLANPAEISALFTNLDRTAGALSILVNSAASFQRQPLEEISLADWEAVQAVNLRAPFLCTQLAAPRIRRAAAQRGESRGSIINIADLSGLYPWKGYAHHGVSKAGLAHLTRIAAAELGPAIRVNAVVPGAVLPPAGVEATSARWREVGERLPVGKTGEPARVGEAVVFLASNNFITGELLRVDGGEHLFAGSGR